MYRKCGTDGMQAETFFKKLSITGAGLLEERKRRKRPRQQRKKRIGQ